MRILHLRTLSGTGGGPEKTIFNSCDKLREYNITADVFYIIDNSSSNIEHLKKLAKNANVNVFVVCENSPFSLNTIRTFKKIIKEGNYDIVHSHEYKTNLFAALYKKDSGYKFITTAHGYNPTSIREHIYYQLDRFSFKKADVIITPAKFFKDYLSENFKVKKDKIKVIYNGIDVKEYSFNPHSMKKVPNILYLGRLSKEKNIPLLIYCVAKLRDDNIDVKLTIAGDGQEKERLESLISKLRLYGEIELTGFVERKNVGKIFSESDIFVLPSRTEVLPNVILEAMAVGIPIIASNVGGIPELIRDGIDGFLFESDNLVSLVQKIKTLIESPEAGGQFVRNARKRVEELFTFEKHINETVKTYKELVQ